MLKTLTKLLLPLVLLALPYSAYAAIAFDTANTLVTSGTATTMAGSAITIAATGNPILLCGIDDLDGIGGLVGLAVTYNGVSMTQIGTTNSLLTGENLYVFALLAPTTGSAIQPQATWSSGGGAGAEVMQCLSYTGVSQSALPTNTQNSNFAAATTLTATIAVNATSNSWVTMWARNQSGVFTAGTNSTIRNQNGSGAIGFAWADSNTTVTPSANFSQTLTWSGTQKAMTTQIQLQPPVVATTNPFISQIIALFGTW